jgi:relA/spoT family protein
VEEILHFYIKIIIITLIYSEKGQTVRRRNMATGDSVISMRNFDDIVKDKPDDFVSKEYLYDELIKAIRRYHPSDDISMIEKAYELADKAHKDQKRKSGEPYIIHPLCVAKILADLELDKESIIAGILHDVVEDTVFTYDELKDMFGVEVANLVDGVTKLTQLSWDKDKVELQAENLRKMFLAMAKDIRVILIKLADRLHNMRTLQYMKPEKQKEKARETLDIYSPIAQRLGISKIKVELDDLALKYLKPDIYEDLVEKITLKKEQREDFVHDIVLHVQSNLKEAGIEAQINGRVKHFFSIYKKMVSQNKDLEQIYDLFAVRIIVDTLIDCYAALGVIHELYKPIPGRFKDYIAMPKPNMYQSLHTTLIADNGQPFEIQIRTKEMHKTAEFGIAAHWKYKESGSGKVAAGAEDAKMNWLRQILEWQKDTADNKEFLNFIKSDLDLFTDNVYCFTPQGDVKNLPKGSVTIDFAYAIHSAVGNKMIGARVNGKLVNKDYMLHNGDRVEIITSQNSKGPSRDWLNIVKSTQAKNKINQWFKTELKEDNIIKGKELLEKYCKAKGINLPDINKPEYQEKVMKRYAFRDWNAVLASVGHGGIKEGQIINKMVEEKNKQAKKNITDTEIIEGISSESYKAVEQDTKNKSKSGIVVRGMHDLAVRFSRCCSPVPGDEIVGFVTRGRGVSIHRTDCINIISLPEEERVRLIPAEWQSTEEDASVGKYQVEIQIYANNRIGMFVDISKVFTEKGIDIKSVNIRTNKQGLATISMQFETKGTRELHTLSEKIRQISGVIDIERTSS